LLLRFFFFFFFFFRLEYYVYSIPLILLRIDYYYGE